VLKFASWVLRILRVGNWLALVMFLACLGASALFEPQLLARVQHKYHGAVDPFAVIAALRWILALGIVAVAPTHVLLTALLRMVRSVADGDPFVAINARRLHAIGWALLALQLIEVAFNLLAAWVGRLGADFTGGGADFAIAGWVAVLLVFVLARIFAQGTAMRDELEMTV
jgi:hypothetical protein